MFKLKCFAVFYLVLIVGFFVAVDAKKLMTNVKVNQGGKQSYLQDDLYKALVSGEKDIETCGGKRYLRKNIRADQKYD